MLRSALLLLSGNAAASALMLARNLIVARLVPVHDYGIAATFAVLMAVVEMMSQLGLQQQIVQARDGNDPRFQAGLQGFQVLRGLMAGGALVLLAGPAAAFMGVPEAAPAYRWLALVPVCNALVHFDVYRLNRSHRFGPAIVTGTVPVVLAVLALWPLAHSFGDYRVMLWSILIQSVLTVAVSHLMAERPYRLVLDRAQMAASLRFGWPLLLNGVLLFLVFNGDRLIVARELGMTELAIFSMGVTLTLTPTLVMAKSMQNLFLPRLSHIAREAPGGAEAFHRMSNATLQANLLNGAVMVPVVLAAGGALVQVVLGAKYAALLPLLGPLAVLHALRVFKAGSAVVALAEGRTGNAMLGNLPRVLVLPMVWFALHLGADLPFAIGLGIAAETFGLALSLALLRGRLGVPLAGMGRPFVAAALALAAGLLPDAVAMPWRALASAAGCLALLAVSRDLFAALARRHDTTRPGE